MGSTCGATCGITKERDRQKDGVRALVQRAFPDGTLEVAAWEPDAPPFAFDEAVSLARALEEVLPCQVRVRAAEGCDELIVVATMSQRSWVALRDGAGDAPDEGAETALRVMLSPWGRYATLQEVRVRGERDGDGWWIEEERLEGVDDKRLAMFVKAIQGLLRAKKIVTLDAAFLTEPVGSEHTLWNALFDRDPMATRTGVWVPGRGSEALGATPE